MNNRHEEIPLKITQAVNRFLEKEIIPSIWVERSEGKTMLGSRSILILDKREHNTSCLIWDNYKFFKYRQTQEAATYAIDRFGPNSKWEVFSIEKEN